MKKIRQINMLKKKYLNFPALSFWLRPVGAGKNLAGRAKISISSWLSTQLTDVRLQCKIGKKAEKFGLLF